MVLRLVVISHWSLVIVRLFGRFKQPAGTLDSELPTPNSRLLTTDYRLPTIDSELPTTDSRLPTTHWRWIQVHYEDSFGIVNIIPFTYNTKAMKTSSIFKISIIMALGFTAIACSKSGSSDSPVRNNTQQNYNLPPSIYYLNASNWVKKDETTYICVFQNLLHEQKPGTANPSDVKVFVDVSGQEFSINNSFPYMEGKLGFNWSKPDLSIIFTKTTGELPFTSINIKVVFQF